MDLVIVLVTEGKHESVDYATILTFEDRIAALKFCKENSTGKTKNWKNAEIVKSGERIELCQPD